MKVCPTEYFKAGKQNYGFLFSIPRKLALLNWLTSTDIVYYLKLPTSQDIIFFHCKHLNLHLRKSEHEPGILVQTVNQY